MIILPAVVVTPPDTGNPPFVPPYIDERVGLGVMLVGVDGSTWDLYDGPVRLLSGSTGFGTPKPTHWWRESPAIDGGRWQGMRTGIRDTISMPIYIHDPDSLGWRDTDAAFFDAISPDGECQMMVTTPDAETRTLTMRFVDGGDAQYDVDPLLLRYGAYSLQFAAADPYWLTDPIVQTFQNATAQPLFPGPPFNINPANTLASGVASNPGDVAAWPRWKITGPFTAFTVGVGDSIVQWSGSKPSGYVVVDMDPRARTIVDEAGADAWLQVTEADFAPIPAGADVPLSLDVAGGTGTTSIELAFTPRYRRAW